MLRAMSLSFRRVVMTAWLCALVGCSPKPPQSRLPVPLPDRFAAAEPSSSSEPTDVSRRWWHSFDDEDLNELIERGLSDNFDLRMAWDRLRQAEATARREGATLVPTFDLQASTTRTELTQTAAQGSGAGGRNDFRLGIAAAYEIDLWGRLRSARSAARLDAVASTAELRSAAMTLSAEIARTWFALLEHRAQLDLMDAQSATNEHLLNLVTFRFRSGQVGATDVLRQRQALAALRGDRFPVEAEAAALEHRLAVLVGVPAAGLPLPEKRVLPALSSAPTAILPAEVVARRPDIQRAYVEILAQDERLAVAKADRYPRLTLTGNAAFSARALRDVLDNWLATFTAALLAPLIDGGQRAAEVERVRAVVSERVHAYGQTVLDSLREVEDALSRDRAQSARLASLDEQLELSAAATSRLREQYLYGSTPYLDVLESMATYQSLQRARVTALRQLIEHRIELYRATGGAFDLSLPEPRLARSGDESIPNRSRP